MVLDSQNKKNPVHTFLLPEENSQHGHQLLQIQEKN